MSNKEPLISVIVPVYKVEDYLEQCVNSIRNQSYKNLEIILVDDGSPDNSGKLCDKLADSDNRIRVIHKQNGGLSSARNSGIDIAKGDYLSFVDSDDDINKDMIKSLYEAIASVNADFSCCQIVTVAFDGTRKKYDVKNELDVFYDNDVLNNYWDNFSSCGKLYRKELFNTIRYPVGKLYEDARTMYKVAGLAKRAATTSYFGYNYYMRQNSIMHSYKFSNMFDRVIVYNEISDGVLNRCPEQFGKIQRNKNRLIIENFKIILKESPLRLFSKESKKLANELLFPVDNNDYLTKKEKRMCKFIYKIYGF